MITNENLSINGLIEVEKIHSLINVKHIDVKINEIDCHRILAFPLDINGRDLNLINAVGRLSYTMKIYRKNKIREVYANHAFYVRDVYGSPTKITLKIQVCGYPIISDIYDEKLFDIAYVYAKTILEETHFPECGYIDFGLSDSYRSLKQVGKRRYDGYDEFRTIG